jgi:hypothetical protein
MSDRGEGGGERKEGRGREGEEEGELTLDGGGLDGDRRWRGAGDLRGTVCSEGGSRVRGIG